MTVSYYNKRNRELYKLVAVAQQEHEIFKQHLKGVAFSRDKIATHNMEVLQKAKRKRDAFLEKNKSVVDANYKKKEEKWQHKNALAKLANSNYSSDLKKTFLAIMKKENLIMSKSPFGESYYLLKKGEKITWGVKPENSYRLANHWNFTCSYGGMHCISNTDDSFVGICKFINNQYKEVK